jgi:Helix-turn-helix of DDE superfamily endonuclease
MNSLDIMNSFAAKEEIVMASSYKDIRNERQWKAMPGLTQVEFTSLSLAFGSAYEQIHRVSLQQGLANLGKAAVLGSYEECLFFTLFQLKTAQSFDCLGVLFNMDGSSAQRNFTRYLQVLELALQQQGALPRRSFANLNEFRKYLQQEQELIADATEIRTHRPADKDKREQNYSGKKKPIR